ncbi:AfsR/SARP family transcriptional regulator [Paractinoplanes durhamensis]|uniref:AfsR/SARP family transcriptional regulator n=1 Tax=Paractinoplanes durhamensis TaxID=113563 RepID=UPI00363F6903
MEIAVLGAVELRAGTGDVVPVAGARLRTLLLLLALDANRVVTADRLIDGVWGDEPPQAAGNALQALVSRLRRTTPELIVEVAPNGYRLVIDPDRIDANRFLNEAADNPEAALKLWRGDLDFPRWPGPMRCACKSCGWPRCGAGWPGRSGSTMWSRSWKGWWRVTRWTSRWPRC